MRALKYIERWQTRIEEIPELECLEADDVIVDVAVCGVCGTDVGIVSGAYPVAISGTTLGHEASGVVSRVGAGVTRLRVGDRVVINPTYSCGQCRMCLIGNANHCERKSGTEAGVSYDGTFSGQYRGKEAFLVKLDDHVSMEAASFTEPLSCVITGVDKLAITHTDIRAAVVGAGPMGMLYLWALHQRGVKAFLVEKNDHRRRYVGDHVPPACALYGDFEEALEGEYGGRDAQIDLCVDTTGHVTELVFSRLAPGGKLLNVALKDTHATLDVMRIADKSLSVIGSIDSLNNSFERAYAMIRDNEIPVTRLISQVFTLDDYMDAFRAVGCDIRNQTMAPFDTPSCKVLVRLADLR